MLRVFQNDLVRPGEFIITLELVPGKASSGRSVDTVMEIATAAFYDGRVSAVSITDNPGGNPSLSPDVIGHEIFKVGMDVIVHFTCRDMNRAGMESRALQLSMMGMKNLLALTGDYTGKGFGGQGAPVFDLDSVNLLMMLNQLNSRFDEAGDPDGFFAGCAVSPFKYTESECFAQYAKLCRKISAGAQFIITQLGFDARKFFEFISVLKNLELNPPVFGSVYLLTPRSAKIMNSGAVPGAAVSRKLLDQVVNEWKDSKTGRIKSIERAAKLGAILKGLGYHGMHIGGIHHSFDAVAGILDTMEKIDQQWRDFLPEFDFPIDSGFYLYPQPSAMKTAAAPVAHHGGESIHMIEKVHYRLLETLHHQFFSFDAGLAPTYQTICRWIDQSDHLKNMLHFLENTVKKVLLNCQQCGDCGIQHLAFLCPESQCPKHTRNGACGGSRQGKCEVRPEKNCVWVKAYHRLAAFEKNEQMMSGCVPPRMWELNRSSSWLNFHLKRDHQSVSAKLGKYCLPDACQLSFCAALRKK